MNCLTITKKWEADYSIMMTTEKKPFAAFEPSPSMPSLYAMPI
jgi:hypothetical protein